MQECAGKSMELQFASAGPTFDEKQMPPMVTTTSFGELMPLRHTFVAHLRPVVHKLFCALIARPGRCYGSG